jgi:SAM-dependent methyltransferase
MRKVLKGMLERQYARTMKLAYASARTAAAAHSPAVVLDCGSGSGQERLATFGMRDPGIDGVRYQGLEWSREDAERGRRAGLDITVADLNRPLPVESDSIDCVIAYSVVEHLLMPCSFIEECFRVLRPGGRLVILTPNISTYFTAFQILLGKMPSSGPHPDSNRLISLEQPPQVSLVARDDVRSDTPQHRHLVVFSYRVLRRFLSLVGFTVDGGSGFGYYPLPIPLQSLFERLDPYHCHQLVFVCSKPR